MEQNQRERIIKQFVDHAMATWNDGNTSHPDMKEVARGLGMSEEEIAEVVRVGEIYYEHGSAHRRAERLDEAIEQLTISAAIDPTNVDRLQELAIAYSRRYVRDANKADRKEAQRLVKRIHAIDPDRDAAETITQNLFNRSSSEDAGSAASKKAVPDQPVKQAISKRKLRVLVLASVMNALIIGGVFFFTSSKKHPVRVVEGQFRTIPVVQNIDAGASSYAIRVNESSLDNDARVYHMRGSIISTQPGRSLAGVTLHLAALDSGGVEALTTPVPLSSCDGALCFDYTGPSVLGLANVSLSVKEGGKP